MSEVENNLDRIKSSKGVKCIVTVSNSGDPLHVVMNDSDMEESEAKQFAKMAYLMTVSTKAIIGQELSSEELQVMRVRMKENEITVVPEDKYYLIVIQDPKRT